MANANAYRLRKLPNLSEWGCEYIQLTGDGEGWEIFFGRGNHRLHIEVKEIYIRGSVSALSAGTYTTTLLGR